METNAADDPIPAFWDKEPSREEKLVFQQGYLDYMEYNARDPEKERTTREFVAEIVPMIALKLPKWKGFPKEQFNVKKHKAHYHLYHAINNRHNALVKEIRERRKPADEPPVPTKPIEEAEAQLR